MMRKERECTERRGRDEMGSESRMQRNRIKPFVLLMLALTMTSSLFAGDWRASVFSAMMISALVLVLLLVVITVLKLDQLRHMVYDEFGQMAVTVLIAVLIIGGMGETESIARSIGWNFGAPGCPAPPAQMPTYLAALSSRPFCDTLQDQKLDNPGLGDLSEVSDDPGTNLNWAKGVNQKHEELLNTRMREAIEFNAKLGAASSVSGFCNLMGVGVSIAGCSAYGTLRGPTGQMLTAMGTGVMETKTERFLLLIAEQFALTLLVPLGLILRCLHFTRKAGGTLIALGLSLYLILPTSIILTQALCDRFVSEIFYTRLGGPVIADPPASIYPTIKTPNMNSNSAPNTNTMECDPYEPDERLLASSPNSTLNLLMRDALNSYDNKLKMPEDTGAVNDGVSPVEQIIFLVIVRTLLMGALVLTVLIASVRALGHALGSEIDVYAIARLS